MGYFWALCAALFWGCIGPFGTYCVRAGLSPQEVAFWRALFGAAFFIVHLLVFRLRVRFGAVLLFALFGCVGVGAFFSLYQLAVAELGAGLAAVLLYTAPAWVALFSRFLFRERLDTARGAALLLVMLGAGLVCLSGGLLPGSPAADMSANVPGNALGALAGISGASFSGGARLAGIACGLGAGFCYSLHYVFTRIFLGSHPAAVLYACCLPAGALCIMPFVEFAPKSPDVWVVLLLGSGFLTCYAAYSVYCRAMKCLSPTRVAVIATFEPVAAALLAALCWGERLNALGIAGGLVVVCGALCSVFGAAPKARSFE